jgi:hypothetical protein
MSGHACAGRLALLLLTGCGGGAPLLHPAHVLAPGFVAFGAGASGQLMVRPSANAKDESLRRLSVAPGVAPVVAARIGVPGANEVGLTYTGRSVRADARHAFQRGDAALSVGLGASMVLPGRPPGNASGNDVYGAGADVPIVVGARSRGDAYAIWAGARGGFELLSGNVGDAGTARDVSVRHVYGGGLVGVRGGFRHVHVAIEVDAAYHRASGTIGPDERTIDGFVLTPAGALIVTF